VPVLLLVSLISFAIVRLIPGDPAVLMLGPGATQQQIDALRKQQGLDRPLPVQFVEYMGGLLTGNLGTSIRTGRPIWQELGQRLPATAELALMALVFAVPIGLLLALVSAVRRNTPIDHLTRLLALLAVSVPVFWLALVAQIVFGLWLDILPVSGRADASSQAAGGAPSGFLLAAALLSFVGPLLLDALRHLVLPALVLGAFLAATIARMGRASLLEVLGEDFVRTARAKGLRERQVLATHALRNALLPVVTITGLKFAELLSGAVLTETIFAWPGLGRYMFEAIQGRDYPVVQSTTLLFAVVFIIVLLLVDMLSGVLDPRLQRAGAG
jgi:ABC-type dipeptide/oligopeptide/nickel transport system permease component